MLVLSPDEMSARRRLAALSDYYPLPGDYKLVDDFFERARVARLELSMVGLVAKGSADGVVTGSAAEAGGYPIDRAYFELLERVSVMLSRNQPRLPVRAYAYRSCGELDIARVFPADADPSLHRRSLSNGVALHETWQDACQAAFNELLERDAILSSFRGRHAPQRVECASSAATEALTEKYTAEVFTFGQRADSSQVTAGVFLFPREVQLDPLAFGFASARCFEPARAAAEREALQRLAFLMGEPLPTANPEPGAAPEYHQDYYLFPKNHAHLRQWLTGELRDGAQERASIDRESVDFIDLTPRSLHGRMFVAKAQSPHAEPLVFGPPRAGEPPFPHPIA